MLGRLILAAVGVGFAAGVATTGKLGGVKRKVENSIKPRRNKVAHIKVDLEEGVDPADLRFVVVQPARNRSISSDFQEDLD